MERNLCLLILFCSSLLASEDFWFSYRVITEDKYVVYEERYISPRMTVSPSQFPVYICNTQIKKNANQSTAILLNQNFDEVLACFYAQDTRLVANTTVTRQGVREIIEFTVLPASFTVEFKDQFAIIKISIPQK